MRACVPRALLCKMDRMNEHSRITNSPRGNKGAATLLELRARRDEILRIAEAYDAGNVRVFGSVARAEADADSDVDLLVDITTDAKGFAYFGLLDGLREALADTLGRQVDVVDSAGLNRLREWAFGEAVPL